MILLLDLGNTRLKWAIADEDPSSNVTWQSRGAVAWNEDVVAALANAWRDAPRVTRVLASSVVDLSREANSAAVVSQMFERDTFWLRTPASACGVRNAYAEPERLGVDRFLAMVAAHATAKAPYVLAGIGTALTLDALGADGRHLGGLIAPGPQLMQQALLGATARVRPERPGVVLDVADNTADAVVSGCWQAVAALIERFVTRVSIHLDGSPRVLLDGGDAAAILPLLDVPAELTNDSVLRGLFMWAAAHP